MNKVFSYVAIPTEDFERAFKFYSEITGGLIVKNSNVPFPIAYFTDAFGDNVGHLFQLPNFKPSADGAIVYMELAKDLNEIIAKIENAGGKVLMPKTMIAPDKGYWALFSTRKETSSHYTLLSRNEGTSQMNIEGYIDSLPDAQSDVIREFRKIIIDTDPKVVEKAGKIMSVENTLNYYQGDVIKYGLAVTKGHISFHSMVMYANPILKDYLRQQLADVKFQMGCINFKNLVDFPSPVFKAHMVQSANTDFSPVIERYRSRK